MEIYLTTQAHKDYKELPKSEAIKVKRKLQLLEKEPRSGKKLAGKLAGHYSLKAWPYRIIYLINGKKEVWIIHILHRQGVYK